MEKIYWDEEAQQIKTKSGKCVFNSPINLESRITKLESRGGINSLEIQLRCAAKGHKMEYVSIQGKKFNWSNHYDNLSYTSVSGKTYTFRCSVCGLKITKTKDELTTAEKEGLKKLKLL